MDSITKICDQCKKESHTGKERSPDNAPFYPVRIHLENCGFGMSYRTHGWGEFCSKKCAIDWLEKQEGDLTAGFDGKY